MSSAEIIQFTPTHTHLIVRGPLSFCVGLNKYEAPSGGQGMIGWWVREGAHMSDQQYGVWNKPDTGINGEAMVCERGYKVADKHWGAAYWAALKPVQNRQEEICLTCRVSLLMPSAEAHAKHHCGGCERSFRARKWRLSFFGCHLYMTDTF